jgi:ribonuclease-3
LLSLSVTPRVSRKGNRKNGADNERLEFLGDAVLYLAISDYLYERYGGQDEGFMTRIRSRLVAGDMLAGLADQHTCLGRLAMRRLKKPADEASGPTRARICEDAFEAFLGAMHLGIGFDAARAWLVAFLEANVDFARLVATQHAPKDALHRKSRRFGLGKVMFDVVNSRDCGQVTASVRDAATGIVVATGVGRTRRLAEDAAARNALALSN